MSEHTTKTDDKYRPDSWSEASNSQYITADDLQGRAVTVKVRDYELKMLEQEDGTTAARMVFWFEGKEKGWVSNKTNNLCLEAMFGAPRDVIGKRITIHAETAENGKPGIRVVGSPDLTRDLKLKIKLPKRKASFRTLTKTVVAGDGGAKTAAPEPARAEGPDWSKPAAPSPVMHDGYVPPEIRDGEVPF